MFNLMIGFLNNFILLKLHLLLGYFNFYVSPVSFYSFNYEGGFVMFFLDRLFFTYTDTLFNSFILIFLLLSMEFILLIIFVINGMVNYFLFCFSFGTFFLGAGYIFLNNRK